MTQLRRNIAFQYALQAAKYLFPLITLPYLTRVLGPEGYAVRAYVVAAMVFFQVFLDYGFLSYGTREIAIRREDGENLRRQLSAITAAKGLLCVIAVPALLAAISFIPLLRENALYAILAYLGVCSKALLPDFVFQGIEEMGIMTKRFVVSQAVVVVLVFALIHEPVDLILIPVLELAGSLIALAWSWLNLVQTRSIAPCRVRSSEVWIALRRSTPYFLSNASTTAYTALATVMIGIFVHDEADISYWSLSMSVISMAQSLYSPLSNSIFPRVCVERDFRLVKKTLAIGMPIIALATVAVAALSEVAMLVLGGTEYLPGSAVLAAVSPVLLLSFPAVLLGYPVLAAVGQGMRLTMSSAVAALFSIVGLVVLAISGNFSIMAVCVVRCGTELVLLLARAWFATPYLRFGFDYHSGARGPGKDLS